MLAANETIAEYFYWQQVPFVYRNHDKPDEDRMKALATFITNLGYSIKISKDEVHPKEIQKLLSKIEGTPEEAMISSKVLYTFYISNQTLSGLADTSNYKGLY